MEKDPQSIADSTPTTFTEVQSTELAQIRARRAYLDYPAPNIQLPRPNDDKPDQAWDENLVGLALSGGGIRSATFNLGLLQVLASLKKLRHVDYLSSVSGGGYIASWLQALLHKESHDPSNPDRNQLPIETVEERIASLGAVNSQRPDSKEDCAISFLRAYSNYLTPKLGLLSGDTWAMVVTYLRNALLNLLVLIMALISVMLFPRLLASLFDYLAPLAPPFSYLPNTLTAITIAIWLFLGHVLGSNLAAISDTDRPNGDGTSGVFIKLLIPMLVSILMLIYWMPYSLYSSATTVADIDTEPLAKIAPHPGFDILTLSAELQAMPKPIVTALTAGIFYLMIWAAAYLAAIQSDYTNDKQSISPDELKQRNKKRQRAWRRNVLTSFIAAAVCSPGFLLAHSVLSTFPDSTVLSA